MVFSQAICIAKETATKIGRRAAILCKGLAIPSQTAPKDDPTCQALEATGRWVEVQIPYGNGNNHFNVASAYGYSGASSGGDDQLKNETLFSLVTARTKQLKTTPFYVGTDTNIDPDTDDVIKPAMQNGLLKDLPKDWFPDRKPPATFLREGVYEGMTGTGTSRIDTIFTNFAGGHACTYSGIFGHYLLAMFTLHSPSPSMPCALPRKLRL